MRTRWGRAAVRGLILLATALVWGCGEAAIHRAAGGLFELDLDEAWAKESEGTAPGQLSFRAGAVRLMATVAAGESNRATALLFDAVSNRFAGSMTEMRVEPVKEMELDGRVWWRFGVAGRIAGQEGSYLVWLHGSDEYEAQVMVFAPGRLADSSAAAAEAAVKGFRWTPEAKEATEASAGAAPDFETELKASGPVVLDQREGDPEQERARRFIGVGSHNATESEAPVVLRLDALEVALPEGGWTFLGRIGAFESAARKGRVSVGLAKAWGTDVGSMLDALEDGLHGATTGAEPRDAVVSRRLGAVGGWQGLEARRPGEEEPVTTRWFVREGRAKGGGWWVVQQGGTDYFLQVVCTGPESEARPVFEALETAWRREASQAEGAPVVETDWAPKPWYLRSFEVPAAALLPQLRWLGAAAPWYVGISAAVAAIVAWRRGERRGRTKRFVSAWLIGLCSGLSAAGLSVATLGLLAGSWVWAGAALGVSGAGLIGVAWGMRNG